MAIIHIFGNNFYQQWKENEIYAKDYEKIEKFQNDWRNSDKRTSLEQEFQQFYENQPNRFISVFMYDSKGELIQQSGVYKEDSLIKQIVLQKKNRAIVLDELRIDRWEIGSYIVLLVNQNYHNFLEEELVDHKELLEVTFFSVLILTVLFVTLTNVFLARFIYRPISHALDTLTNGVTEIASGNLDWRIDYSNQDEFKSVVTNFNEMASRLQDMAATQEKNDENQKELIAGISHDLRTPLTAIKAYVEGIEQGVANTPTMQKKYLNIISKKTDDLNHLVNQLFLFSKVNIGDYPANLTRVNIGNFISQFVNSVKDEYRQRGLQLYIEISSYEDYVAVDQNELRTVFINFLENTLKYGNKENNRLFISQFRQENQVIIKFEDNGPGVAEEQLTNIFDVFYRGDKARTQPNRGSGLGLAIAKKMIEIQFGKIYAGKSKYGGLQITICLPMMEKVNE
ncbi:ATP-binding protein [Enterococcus canintestini]|uniref:sensor histidine kinase n=1 Tax=Enterococcus canintestini TaxID=317010 RepID=UPI00288D6357|nr:ATP-binding protein [Enterococcus canintestini]MDT2740614.1 ATP-binding protein [Enterococcus canintestini]